MKNFPQQIEQIADMIDLPLDQWAGSSDHVCRTIMTRLPVSNMRLVKGHWEGWINKKATVKHWHDARLCRQEITHSWLELPDGRILDPTRWCFINPHKPRLYLGSNEDYDEAGHLFNLPDAAPHPDTILSITDALQKCDPQLTGAITQEIAKTRHNLSSLPDAIYSLSRDIPDRIINVETIYKLLYKARLVYLIPPEFQNSVLRPDDDKVPNDAGLFALPRAPIISSGEELFLIMEHIYQPFEPTPDHLYETIHNMVSDKDDIRSLYDFAENAIRSNAEFASQGSQNPKHIFLKQRVLYELLTQIIFHNEVHIYKAIRLARSLGISYNNLKELVDICPPVKDDHLPIGCPAKDDYLPVSSYI